MHLNTRNNNQLLLQHPSVGINSYGRRAFNYTSPTVWNKLPYKIHNATLVTLFRKKLKTPYFKTSSRWSHLVWSGSLLDFDTARYCQGTVISLRNSHKTRKLALFIDSQLVYLKGMLFSHC